jgi:hypothetical protein
LPDIANPYPFRIIADYPDRFTLLSEGFNVKNNRQAVFALKQGQVFGGSIFLCKKGRKWKKANE